MNPETHLLASWVIGAKATDNERDCRLVALAGILPDVDGLGLIVDAANLAFGGSNLLIRHCQGKGVGPRWAPRLF